jgi:RNA polymerase sigma-70 factor (ECF subfamily)
MSETDEALVGKARHGDQGAFEEIVRRTSRLVFARLYLETGDTHRAEDLLQETWLRAFRALGELQDARNLRPWLLAIAHHALTDAVRGDLARKRATPVRAGPAALAEHPDPNLLPEETAERTELRGRVLAVLRSLPEEYRLPLTLRYIAGSDYETIEIQLGLTNGALRGLLHRGLKMLRARLAPEFGPDAGNTASPDN